MSDTGDFYPKTPPPKEETYTLPSGRQITLHLVGASPTEAHHVWNGAKIVSEFFETNPSRIRGKTVLELGAASGLPSLVAGILGATKVVMTDFPDPELIENMQKNIDECAKSHEPKDYITKRIKAMGFIWGGASEPLLDVLSNHQEKAADLTATPLVDTKLSISRKFDVLILADLLFRHKEHGSLVKTIKETMSADPPGVAYVFFTSYRPWKQDKDMAFFDVARKAGLIVEQVYEKKLEKPLFDNDPGDLDIQKTVRGFALQWPTSTERTK